MEFKFTLRELLVVTLTVAGVFTISYLLLPIMAMFPVFIYKPLLLTPVFSILVFMLINNIPKIGILAVFSFILSGVLFLLSPIMFFIPLTAALLVEGVIWVFFGGYNNIKAKIIAASLYPALQIPVALLFAILVIGGKYNKILANLWIVVLFTILSFLFGLSILTIFKRILSKNL
ncbi:hypothetical protein SAMN02745227_01693 [Anaerobranca californiensis DSM 14826]|jgi:hypothetical protein|uniref:Energy-coupling factor transport system substrate-specific component n=1 Tax=Anaerobranca californiensis DSM 14826 TaxID=1120989 RepID=A0A1M6Q9W4_9FIRM|nr:hypothetical protein [Anaerobranca californiensis]SHK17069.1 hypothetical protein SAMN02745227_01693 [Anaerobranca californiensis DSM 14826]